MHYCTGISIARKRETDKQAYLNVAMEEILPMPNMDVPIEEIVDFKNQYRKQLKCFKHRIDEFQWNLRTCENVEEMQERIQMFRREIENDLDEIEELMASNRIRKMKKALRIVIPVGLEAVISTLGLKGTISPMHSIFLTAAVGISAEVFCTEKESQAADDKAYLFYARENGIIMR